jgi:NADH-ubiquinone oxidoreductase chain 1
MTEHAAVVFVFFFLAEYGSIVLMCILTSILFLGGYLLINNLDTINLILLDLLNFYSYIDYVLLSDNNFIYFFSYFSFFNNNSIIEGFLYGFNLGLKSSILIFIFI